MSLVRFQPKNSRSNNWPSLIDDLFMKDFLMEPASRGTSANILKTDDGFQIHLSTPGIAKEDVMIELDDKVLTISHESKPEENQEGKNWIRQEFASSSFKRSFTLPKDVDRDKIKANSKDGVLMINIPVSEEAKKERKKLIPVL